MLVCVNGVFGSRMCDIVERIDGKLVRIDRPWGEVFDPEEIEAALAAHPEIRVVSIVHAETSTGAHQPLEDIGRICRETDRLLVVDAVTSLGGTELEVDRLDDRRLLQRHPEVSQLPAGSGTADPRVTCDRPFAPEKNQDPELVSRSQHDREDTGSNGVGPTITQRRSR